MGELRIPGRVNVHAYPSPIEHESRMLKETAVVVRSSLVDHVLLVGTSGADLPERQELGTSRSVWRVPLTSTKWPSNIITRILQIVEWHLRVLWGLRGLQVVSFSAHNLATLPMGAIVKWMTGAKLVYDTHELESARSSWPRWVQVAGLWLERLLASWVDVTFVVSDSIGDWYRTNVPALRALHVIRNYPETTVPPSASWSERPLRDAFGIRDDELLFLYQGVIDEGRCVELTLDVFAQAHPDRHLVFMGFFGGHDYGPLIREYMSKYPNIHYHPSVPPADVLRHTRSADVGLYLIENLSLSYRLTVGNKVYEYLVSGIPVITSAYPDVSRLVDDYGCGWKTENTVEDVLAIVNDVSREDVHQRRDGAVTHGARFQWRHEEARLIEVYRDLLPAGRA